MPASILWDTLSSAITGAYSVARGAFADAVGLPGRVVAPVAALLEIRFGILNPALSAIVSGDVFPNAVLFTSLILGVICEEVLRQRSNHSLALSVVSNANRFGLALFFTDVSIQSISQAASSAGQSHNLHPSLRLYNAQNILLSSHLFPFFFDFFYKDSIYSKFRIVLKFASTISKCCSLLRIAQLLQSVYKGSGTPLIATGVIALAAAYATRRILLDIFYIYDSSRHVKYADTKRKQFENRALSASRAFFFGTLSLHNDRPLMLDGIAVFYAFEALSPFSLADFCKERIFKPSFELLCSAVTWLYVAAWPVIQRSIRSSIDFLCRLSVPFTILYNNVIAPLWCVLSPLTIPSIMACIAFQRASNVARALSLLLLFTDGVLAVAAAFSSAVLYAHASSRVLHWNVDPFKCEALRWLASKLCDFVLLPMDLTLRLLPMIWKHVLMPLIKKTMVPVFNIVIIPTLKFLWLAVCAVFKAIYAAIQSAPLVSMVCIFVANVLLMYFCYSSPKFAPIFSSLSWLVATCASTATRLTRAPFFFLVRFSTTNNPVDDKDTVFALGILALIQMSSCVFIRRVLSCCKPPPQQLPLTASQQQMSPQELQALAESMNEPRQCPVCAFGPVDHFGCSNLRSHHGDVLVGGARISNACPSCGFFGQSKDEWLPWLPRTESAMSFRRLRAWNEVVVIVRASVKSMGVPLVLMHVCSAYSLNPSLAAVLVVAWSFAAITENVRFFHSLTQPQPPPRPVRAPPAHADDDCGRASSHQSRPIPPMSLEQAIFSIETACPGRVFLVKGAECCVCLDSFGSAAESVVAAGGSGEHVAVLLRSLDPPITPLRCGHALHRSCVLQAVETSVGRHLRCPLCREPVTTGGSLAARVFH